MAQKPRIQKSHFLTKIVAPFLVVLCCFCAPLSARADFFDGIRQQLAAGAQIVTREVAPAFFNPASLASVFDDIKCFFGVDCQKPPASTPAEAPNPKNQVPNNIQEPNINQNTAENTNAVGQGLTSAAAEDRPLTPTQIIQNIQPTKEIQTIRTINNNTNTNTVVVDTATKNKVEQLLRQMNSDRPNYSTGQAVSLPANLVSKTLTISSGDFNVDENGNTIANDITANNDLTVQGNFTVSGSQTYSGAASFTATSTVPALLVEQTGSGNALQADNVTIKTNTINTATGNLILDSATGLVEISGDIAGGKYNGLTVNTTTGILSITNSKTLTVSDDATISGTNTGDQTITLTGDITGSGTGSFTTVIGNSKVTNAMLAGSIAASKLIGTDITAVGTLANLTVTNPISGSITGNAATATKLAATKTINGVAFDGSANISIPSDIAAGTNGNLMISNGTTWTSAAVPTWNQSTTGNAATVTNGVYTNAANSFSLINPLTTIAESWIGPSSTNGMYFKGGNVGIGNTTPNSKLDVSGDIRIHSGSGGQIIFADGSTMSSAGLGSAAALSNTADAIVTGDSGAGGTGDVILKTGSNDRLHILNSGNVGIGTTGPVALLQIDSLDDSVKPALYLRQSNGEAGYKFWQDIDVNGILRIQGVNSGNTTDIVTFDRASGNVGIGTTAPGAKLHVWGTGAITAGTYGDGTNLPDFHISGSYSTTGQILSVNNFAGTRVLTIQGNGNVGIGTTGPSAKLHILDATGLAQPISDHKILGLAEGGTTASTNYAFTVGTGAAGLSASAAVGLNMLYNVGAGTAAGQKIGGMQLIYRRNDDASAIAGGKFLIQKEAASNLSSLRFFTNNTTEVMTIDTAGNVGIGTTSPVNRIHVLDSARIAGSSSAIMLFEDGGVADASEPFGYIKSDESIFSLGYADRNGTGTTGSIDLLNIKSGNVGIGTTGPEARLAIKGTGVYASDYLGTDFSIEDPSGNLTGGFSISMQHLASSIGSGVARFSLDDSNNHWYRYAFNTNGSERMTILRSGNVGIGTTAPASLLDVTGGLTTVGSVLTLGTNEPSVVASDVLGKINFYAPLESDGTDAIAIGASIAAVSEGTFNTTTNTTKLSFMTAASEAATEHMALSSAGVLTVTHLASGSLTSASGVVTSSSDERLKDITGPLEYGLDEVMQLRPIRYHWNERSGIPTGPEYGGFGAAQVEQWMPLAVSYGDDGMRSLSDRPILGALVNAVQKQQGMIDELKLTLDSFGLLDSTSTGDMAVSPAGGLMPAIKNMLQSLGMALQDGVATLREVVAGKATIDQIKNKQIQTEQVCVKDSGNNDICLNGDQLKELIQKAGSSVTINQTYQAPVVPIDNATATAP